MTIAYLIFAYKNPQLINRAIRVLTNEQCDFFVHIDRKSNINDFSRIQGQNVFLMQKRIPVYWAEFSGVEAILLLIRQALAHARTYDYFVLLSGSEYPLRSARYIHAFFEQHQGLEFISTVRMPNEDAGKPISRIDTMRFPSSQPFRRFVGRALARVGLARRDHKAYLRGLEPYSGNTWWALTRDACHHISQFADHNPYLESYFRNVFAPEEIFFHTILGNSPFRSRVRRNLIYEDWSERGPRPQMIDERHVAFFKSREKICADDIYGEGELLFARKFSDDGLLLVDSLDEMIGQSKGL